jgi:uncharacterized cofD-like protein
VTSPTRSTLKLVAIGGGTGLGTLLRGVKPYLSTSSVPELELTAIVTVTDDGRSSGRIRGEFSVLPPGDIRNCLSALADEDRIVSHLFRHRFPGGGEIGGHSLGNLIILALGQMKGDFLGGIDEARALLGIEARVLPSTLDQVHVVAKMKDRLVRGQVAIKSQFERIEQLSLSPEEAHALPQAVEAIEDADLITLGPGSLFTSVIANLLVPEIRDALTRSWAKKIYICNVMTEADETEGFKAIDHLKEIRRYAPSLKIDVGLFNSAPISSEMRERYAQEKAVVLDPPRQGDHGETGTQIVALPLASEERVVRHDPWRLSKAILDIYNGDVS